MYNLSELIKTDCCIDCGTNEKLREVVGKLGMGPSNAQRRFGIDSLDKFIQIYQGKFTTFTDYPANIIHLTLINIDL